MTWDMFADSLPELLAAALGTLRMTAFAFLFAALLGLTIAILRLNGGLTGPALPFSTSKSCAACRR